MTKTGDRSPSPRTPKENAPGETGAQGHVCAEKGGRRAPCPCLGMPADGLLWPLQRLAGIAGHSVKAPRRENRIAGEEATTLFPAPCWQQAAWRTGSPRAKGSRSGRAGRCIRVTL
jgi:hypothetical protein